ncbi:hypothetical protein LUZ61_013751 [Rhynchospora tenuis]|uniref:VQ domain-containing protein n=1 Tax=Rhynchospora tenuis TaxID=198213 RepID=A0AAD5W9S4_9POAL|nr:hypothetical protein LUZ61_013751 [Rhynchospora tenuis]
MADSSSMLDSLFTFHPSSFLARDNEALTKALQMSISEPNTAINSPSSSISTSDSILNTIHWSDPTPPSETRPVKEVLAPTGRVAKRKSRATKRSQTTYITADPSNFRQMVQQVTGIRFEPGLVDAPLLKPEPQRNTPVVMQQGCLLPTLDTSAHVLNQARQSGLAAPVRVERSNAGFGLEPGMSFPTLESWGMIV